MGKLVEGKMPTLFGGVSRQPDPVRQPGQFEVVNNALLSVVTGGFEKRPPTQHLSKLTFLDNTVDYKVHPIDRDDTEQTFVLLGGGNIFAVNAITGAQITVTIGDTERYFLVEKADLNSTGVIQVGGANFEKQLGIDSTETAFDWSWQLSDGTTGRFKVQGSPDGSTWHDIQTNIGGATSGTFSTTIGAVATNDHNYIRFDVTTGMATAADTLTIKTTFKDKTYLLGADAEDLQLVSVADNTFVANRGEFVRLAEADSGTITSTVQEFRDLPAATGSGNIHRVRGSDTDGFGTFYVLDNGSGDWIETVDPTAHNNFDVSSMPHRLIRNADGTFTFQGASWSPREAGDEDLAEAPTFVGRNIQDIAFFRNRLVFLADESCYLSQSGDVFDFWPQKAVDVLDTDPIDRAASTTDINILKFATVFRKIMFATSRRAQFELTSDSAFTPTTAQFDQATTYQASPISRPASMGDTLYFGSKTQGHALVYEYFFDESALSNTAADVTKHVRDFIPNDILQIATDPSTQTVFALSTGEQNVVFAYKTFFEGAEKLQSAWGRYVLGSSEANAFVHGMATFSGFLVMLVERHDGSIYLEQIPIDREEQDSTLGFSPFIDQREFKTGAYDSTNDCTVWQSSWEHQDDAEVILGPNHTVPGRQLTPFYTDKYTLTLASVAAGETLIIGGKTFTAHATTTTTANREFSISGNDVADAGELTTVLNDAPDGIGSTHAAVDNGDGTVTVVPDDACDGTLDAPTGTAITNATITADEVKDLIAARGDHSGQQAYLGRKYTMTIQLSKIFFRDEEGGSAVVNGRLQLRDITFQFETTGFMEIKVTPKARTAKSYKFEGKILGSSSTVIGSAPIEPLGAHTAVVASDASTVQIEIINDKPVPCVVTSAAWRGFFNEFSRQG